MATLRFNNVFGASVTLTNVGGPADNVATFSVAPNFPTIVAPDIAKIIVDPDSPTEEIIYVVAYTAAALTASVARAQESSTQTAHLASPWVHGPTAADIGSGSGGGGAGIVAIASSSLIFGDTSSGSLGFGWQELLSTTHDLTLPATPGDVIEFAIDGAWAGAASTDYIDVKCVTSGTQFGQGGVGGVGVPSWAASGNIPVQIGGSAFRTLVGGDISSGNVTLRVITRTTSGRLLYIGTFPLVLTAINHGPVGGGGGGGGGTIVKDTVWTPPGYSTTVDEFNDGVLDPAWVSVVASGSQSVIEQGDVLSILVNGQANAQATALLRPMGSFSIGQSIETAMRFMCKDYVMTGPLLTDGTTAGNNALWNMPYISTGPITLTAFKGTLNALTNAQAMPDTSPKGWALGGWLYARLKWVAANTFQCFWSLDGVQWTDFGRGTFVMAFAPTHIGVGASTWSQPGDGLVTYEYMRVV